MASTRLQKEAVAALGRHEVELGIEKLKQAVELLQDPNRPKCSNAFNNSDLEILIAETYINIGDYENGKSHYIQFQDHLKELRSMYVNGIEERLKSIESLEGMDQYNMYKQIEEMEKHMIDIDEMIAGCYHDIAKCYLALTDYEQCQSLILKGIQYVEMSKRHKEDLREHRVYTMLQCLLSVVYDIVGNSKESERLYHQLLLQDYDQLRYDCAFMSIFFIDHGNFMIEDKNFLSELIKIQPTKSIDEVLHIISSTMSNLSFNQPHPQDMYFNTIDDAQSPKESNQISLSEDSAELTTDPKPSTESYAPKMDYSDPIDMMISQAMTYAPPLNENTKHIYNPTKDMDENENESNMSQQLEPMTEEGKQSLEMQVRFNKLVMGAFLEVGKVKKILTDEKTVKYVSTGTIKLLSMHIKEHMKRGAHPLTLVPKYIELAIQHSNIDEIDLSEEAFKKALDIALEYTGESPYTATVLAHYAKMKLTTNQQTRALELLTRALDIRIRKYGNESEIVAVTTFDLSVIYWSINRNIDSLHISHQSNNILQEKLKSNVSKYTVYLAQSVSKLSKVMEKLEKMAKERGRS